MNAVYMAKKAYGAAATPVRAPRNTEYALFARVTKNLRSAIEQEPMGFNSLAHAVFDNRKLWSTLAIDVAHRDNGLPDSLRGRILYLARFVEVQSRRVLKREASANTLVDINTAIMRGLESERWRQ